VIRILLKSILLALLIGLTSARPALAYYIDPNTGGQLFQILATSFALLSGIALLFARQIRAGVARIKRFLRTSFGSSDSEEQEHSEQSGEVQ
jgi:hypothetical protein